MSVRDYRAGDTPALIALFRDTVRQVNLGDYSAEQIAAWAPDDIDLAEWTERQARDDTVVADIGGAIAGFAELQDGDHIHMLFVHKDHQGRGVATGMVARVEEIARRRGARRLTTAASITGRPFFERRGFSVLTPRLVALRGQEFRNFWMEKVL